MGPGSYNPELAEEKMRARSPTTKMSRAASRPKSFANPAHEGTAGPGAYDDGKKFGADVKPIKISRTKRIERRDPNGGPGEYNFDRAVS